MRFSKWHALGNSYLLLERAELGAPLPPAGAERVCDPHRGIGADGVLEVVSAEENVCEVRIWNPDGSTAELSGNGTRIAAAWVLEQTHGEDALVRVGPREVAARRRGNELETDVGPVAVGKREKLDVGGETVEFRAVNVGNPHAVLLREPELSELRRLGPLVERHPRFRERTNVQLARFEPPSNATALVWERGAGETPASGTSAVAVAAVGVAEGALSGRVRVHMPGGHLTVEFADDRASVLGPAVKICEGDLEPSVLIHAG